MDCELPQVSATDSDDGENGRVTYRIENRAETHSDWFDIEPETGTKNNVFYKGIRLLLYVIKFSFHPVCLII